MKRILYLITLGIFVGFAGHAQNVGIGTTTPETKLSVKINTNYGYGMENSATNSSVVIKTFLGLEKGQIGTTSQHPFELMAGDGNSQFTLMPNGNVGIGTKPVLGKFVVRGTVGAVSAIFGDNTAGVSLMNAAPSIGFNYYYSGGARSISTGFGGSVGVYENTGQFFIATSANSVTGQSVNMPLVNRLLIQPNGYTGIGVTPTSMLDVNGRMRVRATTAQTAGIGFDGGTVANPLIDRGFIGMLNNDYVGLYGSGGAGWGMAMNVNNGFVGIGVATPSAKLDVKSTGGESGLYVGKTGAGSGIHVYSTSTYPALHASNSNGPAIGTQGRVGVNVAYPNSTLEVAGSLSMPVKVITDNYTATANDYSIHFIPTAATGQIKTLTLPSAVGCAGRIYHISANLPFYRGIFASSMLYIKDVAGNNIIEKSAFNDPSGLNLLIHRKWDAGDGAGPAVRKLWATVQSTGSSWIVLAMDYFSE